MKITSIESQKNKDRVNIYIDNLFAIGIENELRYKYKLEIGMEVDDEFITEVVKSEEQNKVINKALNFLSYRQRSEKELYESLRRKGYEGFYIDNAMDYCREQGYLNDKSFAESFIRDKLNLNKLGTERIRYELMTKGVSRDIIDDVLVIDKEEQFDTALALAEKKVSSYKNDDYNKKYRKLGGFLQRKGYNFEIISKVLKKVLED